MSSVTIPNSVTSIGDYAFFYCTGLISAKLSNSITEISKGLFNGCSNLCSIDIPNGVKTIKEKSFRNCNSLRRLDKLIIPASLEKIDDDAFDTFNDINIYITDLSAWCERQYSIPRESCHLYLNGEEIIDLVIPDGVTSIASNAFSHCVSLTSVNIPNSVISIGDRAFAVCKGLTSISIPYSVTTIGEAAFYYCSNVQSIKIPNGVITIKSMAFEGCRNLKSITLPYSMEEIDENAFNGFKGKYINLMACDKLKPITVSRKNWNNIFHGVNENTTIFLPGGRGHSDGGEKNVIIGKIEVGDTNNDGAIDVTDIVGVANYIHGRPSDSFNMVGADANSDGDIDVTDIVTVANIILHGNNQNNAKERIDNEMHDPQ